MKSLDKLRSMELWMHDEDERGRPISMQVDMTGIVDEIIDEIYENFLPMPLYEDGEPVCIGDRVRIDAGKHWSFTMFVDRISYDGGRSILLTGCDEDGDPVIDAEIAYGERVLRPRGEVDK